MTTPVSLTFFEHLEELRKRLIFSLSFIGAGAVAGYFYSDKVLKLLIAPIQSQIDQVYFLSPAEAFVVKFKVAFLVGLIAASPMVITQLWLFIAPALRDKEKKFIIPLVFITFSLFTTGVLFCYYFAMPYALNFLIGMQTDFLKPVISIKNYIDLLFGMFLAFGISFNTPVFVMAMASLGLLSSKTLNKYQKHAIVIIFVVAAVVTPTPDFTGQIMLAIPLILLFEISVLGVKAIEWFRH